MKAKYHILSLLTYLGTSSTALAEATAYSCAKHCRLNCQDLGTFDKIHLCETKTCGCKLNVVDEAKDVLEAMGGMEKDGRCRAIGGECLRPNNLVEWIRLHFAGSIPCENHDETEGEVEKGLCPFDYDCCIKDHGVDFHLYTRDNPAGEEIKATNASILQSNFNAERATKVIIHGFTEHGFAGWIKDMVEAFLTAHDCNVIAVDWGERSGETGAEINYPIIVGRLREIGYHGADLFQLISETTGAHFSDFHVIGHSLGSHLASHIGHKIIERSWGRLARITGLDAAGLLFNIKIPGLQHLSPELEETIERSYDKERLSQDDAVFVDAIHTTDKFGRKTAFAHADFYPNGGIGKAQPGCEDSTLAFCGHVASNTYFTESIKDPQRYEAKQCGSWKEFLAEECDGNPSNWMGMGAKEEPSGAFYLKRDEF